MKTYILSALFILSPALLSAAAWLWACGSGSQGMEAAWDIDPFASFSDKIWVAGEFSA